MSWSMKRTVKIEDLTAMPLGAALGCFCAFRPQQSNSVAQGMGGKD